MCPTANLSALDNIPEPVVQADAFDEAVHSFSLLTAFFDDTEVQGINLISRHGSSYAMAYEYLLAGFDAELVGAILETYTFTNPDGTLMIIPCEGIPLLTINDRAKATIIPRQNFTIIQIPLQNCYQLGDQYRYQITSRLIDQHWKITALSLIEE